MSHHSSSNIIVLIHQSSSLYGSDKTLLLLALAIQKDPELKPIVVLPEGGPLVNKLKEFHIEVVLLPVVKVSRSLLSITNIWKLPIAILRQTKAFKKRFNGYNIQIIHSNTLAVLMGMLVYKHFNARHVWHVHEIIEKPKLVNYLYRFILPKFSDVIITPSKAVKDFWKYGQKQNRGIFKPVLNGIPIPQEVNKGTTHYIKKEFFKVPEDAIVIALVGRINRHKGHNLLLNAFERLSANNKNVYLIMVGSTPPEQEFLKDELLSNINSTSCADHCRLLGFYENISEIWATIDIAVVPTTLPEPFGLVALEAMLAKKPVIASNDGGLKEIVVDKKSGYLFESNNETELTEKLQLLIENKELRQRMGSYGYQRAISEFSEDKYSESILNIYKELIKQK